jgi:heme-degrading monooxygenase HmoA
MSVTFVNLFEVQPGRDAAFLELWQRVNTYMQGQPGYLDHRLHRALTPDARYRFVNLAHWASEDTWQAAHDEGFRALVGDPAWQEFPPFPTLYEVVHEGHTVGAHS